MLTDVPEAVLYTLWILALVVVVGLIPVVIYTLHHLSHITSQVERNISETLNAGLGVAGNTAHVVALEDTIKTATQILGVAGSIDKTSGAIENLLESRAARR